MKNLITLTLATLLAVSANAQYKFGTLDIRTSKSYLNFYNGIYTPLNGKFIIHADKNFPYNTDFTTAGTNIIINPGGNYKFYMQSIKFPTIKNSSTELALFFYDRTGVGFPNNYIPYVTDGTLAGTVKLKEFKRRSMRGSATSMQNKFYFSIEDSTTGDELWMSDGTPAGTQLLIDLYPGATGSQPGIFCTEANRFFFVAKTPAYGDELWCSNGTAAGTYMVKDITPGTAGTGLGTSPNYAISQGGIVFFWAKDPVYGFELWRTDGSAAGTYLLKDIKPGSNGSMGASNFAIANNLIFFAADDSVHGTELWATDGTAAGTRMVKDISLATSPTYKHSKPQNLIAYKGEIYFSADDSIHGRELWKTNGEANGTVMVKDICTQGNSDPSSFYLYDGHLFFAAAIACEGNPSSPPKDLHYTDGTAASTVMIRPSTATTVGGITGTDYIEYNGKLFFQGYYHGGADIWYIGDSTLLAGIDNIEKTDITIYPNPAHHNFTIKTTTAFNKGSVTLTDVTGRIVKKEQLHSNQQTIALQGIAPGIYMADVWLDEQRTTQRLVIQ